MLTSFSMVFWWISRSRIHLARSLAKLVFEQQYSVLRSKSRFYPFRKTWVFMIFLIFFDTSLGIDFDKFWHRFRLHFGSLLALFSMFFHDRVLDEFSMLFFTDFWSKWLPKPDGRTPPFSSLFRTWTARGVFEGPLSHLGTLLAPFGSFWAPFLAPFSINVVWNPPFWHPNAQSTRKQPQTERILCLAIDL